MATDKWYVEGALNEVVRAIQDGSSLSITGLEDGYKRRYYDDFKGHWDKDSDQEPDPNHHWPYARNRILKLAEMVGSLATTLTIYKAFQESIPIPRTVDPSSAYMAGYLVKVLCPNQGVWCMKYNYMKTGKQDLDLEALAKHFQESLEEIYKYTNPDNS
jgi:hypothetical protein